MRTFLAILVGASVLATSVVSVRLHHHVANLRYRLWGLEQDRVRAERETRSARAELEAAKAPRRLLERWETMRAEVAPPTRAADASAVSADDAVPSEDASDPQEPDETAADAAPSEAR